MDEVLKELYRIKDHLSEVEYDYVYELIRSLQNKCIPTALLRKDWYIDRVRINDSADDLFMNHKQISYISDEAILRDFVGYGRANIPGQSVFYGAVLSPEIKQPRLAAYLETSKICKHLEKNPLAPENQNLSETFTVSRWRILEDIEVIEMIFSTEALKVSHYAKAGLENQLKNLKGRKLINHFIDQSIFFSNEFARNDIEKNESYKYMVSSAYVNYLWNKTAFRGITYPSVATRYLGQNVALLPEVVDQYLKLESCLVCKFERIDGINKPVNNFLICTDLGKDNMNFTWVDDTDKINLKE